MPKSFTKFSVLAVLFLSAGVLTGCSHETVLQKLGLSQPEDTMMKEDAMMENEIMIEDESMEEESMMEEEMMEEEAMMDSKTEGSMQLEVKSTDVINY